MAADYFSGPRPRIFGHRGAAGEAPENTMVSFRRAIEQGAEILELDVHASRDGVVLVIHDATLERTTDGAGAVRDFAHDEIRRLDAGYHFVKDGRFPFRGAGVRVPSLQELLEEFPGVPLNIEIKQEAPPIEATVISMLQEHDALERVMLAAENDFIMKRIRQVAPEALTSLSAAETAEFFQRSWNSKLDGYRAAGLALQIPVRFGGHELVTPQTVESAHALDLEMHVWTINETAEMERLLALGVDGLMSDYPRILREVTEQFRGR